MKDTSVTDFLKNLGDKTPVPGGGAVSALNGAIASAQLKMVCEYTKDEEINAKSAFLTDRTEAFLDLAETDSEAFKAVSEAYKSKDNSVINESLISAAAVSMEIIDTVEELVDFCEQNGGKFNKRLDADLIVVMANLKASVESARAMEETNLKSMENTSPRIITAIDKADGLLDRIDRLMDTMKEGR